MNCMSSDFKNRESEFDLKSLSMGSPNNKLDSLEKNFRMALKKFTQLKSDLGIARVLLLQSQYNMSKQSIKPNLEKELETLKKATAIFETYFCLQHQTSCLILMAQLNFNHFKFKEA